MRNAGPSGEQADIRKESLLFPDSLYCLYCGAKPACLKPMFDVGRNRVLIAGMKNDLMKHGVVGFVPLRWRKNGANDRIAQIGRHLPRDGLYKQPGHFVRLQDRRVEPPASSKKGTSSVPATRPSKSRRPTG